MLCDVTSIDFIALFGIALTNGLVLISRLEYLGTQSLVIREARLFVKVKDCPDDYDNDGLWIAAIVYNFRYRLRSAVAVGYCRNSWACILNSVDCNRYTYSL